MLHQIFVYIQFYSITIAQQPIRRQPFMQGDKTDMWFAQSPFEIIIILVLLLQ